MPNYKPSDLKLLRQSCAQLKEQGWQEARIARVLALTEGWASRTLKKYRQQGQAGLAWQKADRPVFRLTDEQLAQLLSTIG